MSRIEQIEHQVQDLSAEELRTFRDWFLTFDALAWDAQIDADIHAGKLDSLADQALRDHAAGLSTKL
jgi:hypothetical protein